MYYNKQEIETKANEYLKKFYDKKAKFRENQFEAIYQTLTNKRTLVVQKTGWGKSLIYFMVTKFLRDQNKGATMIISPLLSLIDDQIEHAENLGLKCAMLNSTVNIDENIDKIKSDKIDIFFITPETLEKKKQAISEFKISFLVIDEAHCISMWGHDFRLSYSKIIKIINFLPADAPLLATTATANDQVVLDLEKQLGGKVFTLRGDLTRKSLQLENISLKSRAERYAWILKAIPKLKGQGIIYCLTKRDCEYVANFLNSNNISALPYYSNSNENVEENLQKFKKNKIKVIVATIKLGMGFDKGDIAFVIHFQSPENMINYYQQIGRAGRNIPEAKIFLMSGDEDKEILEYFVNSAFPKEDETMAVLKQIQKNNGFSVVDLQRELNLKLGVIKKILMFLEHDEAIYKEKSKYYRSTKPYKYDKEKYDKISNQKRDEINKMLQYLSTKECLLKYIVNSLDDFTAKNCNQCYNCKRKTILPIEIDKKSIDTALKYLKSLEFVIEPRKKFPNNKTIEYVLEPGICLSRWGDPEYAELVKQGKYTNNIFDNKLVDRAAEVLYKIVNDEDYKYITCIPSNRSNIVYDFTKKLAKKLNIEFLDLLEKKGKSKQKEMNNSHMQFSNIMDTIFVKNNKFIPNDVILVDDIVDSRWTLTIAGYKLMEEGIERVFPFALCDTHNQLDD